MQIRHRWCLSILNFFLVGFFSQNIHAEYYLIHSLNEPPINQCPPCPTIKKHASHQPQKKNSHSRNSYHISVYYVWDVNSLHPCGVPILPAQCYCSSVKKQRVQDYVTFSAEPVDYRKASDYEYYETYDQRTGDDDVMRYPDMNNQY